jgi:hypothetical protein
MSRFTEQSIIESFFKTSWPYTPIAVENINFNDKLIDEWVRLTVIPSDSNLPYLGQATTREHGIISVQVFTKAGTGSGAAKKYADQISDLFKYLDIERIRCLMPSIDTIGESGGWYQVNVTTKYSREE